MVGHLTSPLRPNCGSRQGGGFIEGRKSDRRDWWFARRFQGAVTVDHQLLQLGAEERHHTRRHGWRRLATAINRIQGQRGQEQGHHTAHRRRQQPGKRGPAERRRDCRHGTAYASTPSAWASLGKAPYPFRDQFGRVHYQNIDVEGIDEPLMQQMAASTNDGRYFRATNKKALEEIFSQIDDMEKSKIDVTQYAQTKDEQGLWLWMAFCAMLAVLLRVGLDEDVRVKS